MGILPSSQEYEMKFISLKKPSADAVDNIFTQPGARLGEALATAALRREAEIDVLGEEGEEAGWGGMASLDSGAVLPPPRH